LRIAAQGLAGLEPHSRGGSGADRRACPEPAGAVATRTGGDVHLHRKLFVSEASVYRLLKAHDLITSPAFIVIKAADEFKDKTTGPNQLWQTDFTYLKVTGWGWFYLSTILDDFSRYIIACKLCTTMRVEDVTDTLNLALQASGCDNAGWCSGHGCFPTVARVTSPPVWPTARRSEHGAYPWFTQPSPDPGQDRALASVRGAFDVSPLGRIRRR
jgi:transposase InsO family protein